MGDTAKYYVCGDGGYTPDVWEATLAAYPDICRLKCSTCSWYNEARWESCSWTQNCAAGPKALSADVQWRQARARHLGGVNVGFADGHAQWMNSEFLLNNTITYSSKPWWNPGRTDWAITGGIQACGFPRPPQY
jgi:prepilin-type processing-associated H-X9-DG protein